MAQDQDRSKITKPDTTEAMKKGFGNDSKVDKSTGGAKKEWKSDNDGKDDKKRNFDKKQV
jgi:hypothetical protein